jgi:choline dehydrogenase-like flavoprotein
MGLVVDDDCRVNGYSGLFVCDASVFADIPLVNTNIPTVMLAETMATRWLGGTSSPT